MSLRRGGALFLLVLVVMGIALVIAERDADDRSTLSSKPITGALEPADERERGHEPFEWTEADIIDHLGLASDGSGYLFQSESSDAACPIDLILTSAMDVRLHEQVGHHMLTNPSESAGVTWRIERSDGSATAATAKPPSMPPSCRALAGELSKRIGTLRPGARTPAEEAADLAALDDELLYAAQILVDGQTLVDVQWPGLEATVAADKVTVTGSSLGRCRHVVVNGDWTISAPTSC